MRSKGSSLLCRDPRKATLLVYFDAWEGAEMYIMHLLYETHTCGLYQAEFLFSANALVPIGRNIPHAELDAAFRATRQTSLILDWLSNFIVEKALLGDSQVSLLWVQNRQKRTTSFIRYLLDNVHTVC